MISFEKEEGGCVGDQNQGAGGNELIVDKRQEGSRVYNLC